MASTVKKTAEKLQYITVHKQVLFTKTRERERERESKALIRASLFIWSASVISLLFSSLWPFFSSFIPFLISLSLIILFPIHTASTHSTFVLRFFLLNGVWHVRLLAAWTFIWTLTNPWYATKQNYSNQYCCLHCSTAIIQHDML